MARYIKNKKENIKVKLFKKPLIMFSKDNLKSDKSLSHPHVIIGKDKNNDYISFSVSTSNIVYGYKTKKMKRNLESSYFVSSEFVVRNEEKYKEIPNKYKNNYSVDKRDLNAMYKAFRKGKKHYE